MSQGNNDNGAGEHRGFFSRLWPWVILAVILVAYATIEARTYVRAFGETDIAGYHLMARSFALGTLGVAKPDDLFFYQDHIWVENARGEVVCKYAPGYPLILAASRVLLGEPSVFLVNPVMGGLALVGAFMLLRMWMSRLGALLAVAAYGSSLFFTTYTMIPLTHAADLCCVTWAMYFLWRWSRTPDKTSAIGAGLLLGFAVVIRPMNATLMLPTLTAVIAFAWTARRDKQPWRKKVLVLAGVYAVFPFLLALYQWRLFGNPMATGYSLGGEAQSFTLDYFVDRMPRYLIVMRDYVGLPFLVGVFGMMLVGTARERWMRILWAVPPLVIHGFYYWEQPHFYWNLRLILATFVVYYGSAFALLDKDSLRGFKAVAVIGFCALVLALDRDLPPTMGSTVSISSKSPVVALWRPELGQGPNQAAERLCLTLDALPANAVIFAEEPAAFYMAPRRRLEVYNVRVFNLAESQRRWLKPEPHPDWQPRQQLDRVADIIKLYTTHTQADLTAIKRGRIDAELARGVGVYFMVSRRKFDWEKSDLGPAYEWERVPVTTPSAGFDLWAIKLRPATKPREVIEEEPALLER
jgi:hypothetical protein